MKQVPNWLIVVSVCLLFLTFGLGFYLGQRKEASGVRVSVVEQGVTMEQRFVGVPDTTQETEAPTTPTEPPKKGRLNLNEATESELAELPGIGEVLAQRILIYKEIYGNFLDVEELLNVDGIGQGKLDKIRNLIYVEVTNEDIGSR